MRVQDIIIALLLFGCVVIAIFSVSADLNNEFNITIGDEYNDTQFETYNEVYTLTSEIQEKTPGGSDSQSLAGSVTADNTIVGLNVMGLLWKSPALLKSVLFGEETADHTAIKQQGLISLFQINPIFAYTLIACIVVILAIILINSIVKNRW